jgi:predicted DNA-binding transcriptional regulator AlpA
MNETTRYLNEKEVKDLTGFALPTLRNWRFLRKGPPYCKVGGRSIRYRREDVLAYMERARVHLQEEGD